MATTERGKDYAKPERLPAKSENFEEWYSEILRLADVIDYSYPLKACGVWKGFGFKLRKHAFDLIRDLLESTGHEEVLFPFLAPESIFQREAEFAKGFAEEVYWVAFGGMKPLGQKLAIRPTSETIMYEMFRKWIRSHADLPIKVWQLVSTFRYETKATRPLIRVREISTFKEAHTVHATEEEARAEVDLALELYTKFFDALCVPVVRTKRPEFDKFPGAVFTVSFETIFPQGRTLQVGTVHYLGDNFSRGFNITYNDQDGEKRQVYQTCFGLSERVIASIVAVHGDDHGLVLPPVVAPVQVVVVPVYSKRVDNAELEEYCRRVASSLEEVARVKVDLRDLRSGRKYYEWELKGVPVRVEVGGRELSSQTVTLARRDTFEKETAPLEGLPARVTQMFDEIANDLRERARRLFEERIHAVDALVDLEGGRRDAIDVFYDEDGNYVGGLAEIPACDDDECALRLAEYVDVLGTPWEGGEVHGECRCGKPATRRLRVARTY
ncbi:MAG: proline--tRNA ligase [Promethearchaeota archaeon]